ncbi:MAG: hypothetical protein KC619_28235 [Myxococcales bacterium]|nr:hypothetical protein [Myxococcales bacterium]
MRDGSTLGLAWRLVRSHPRAAFVALACLAGSFGAGWALAPRAAPPSSLAPDAAPPGARPGVVVRDVADLTRGTIVEVIAEGVEDAAGIAPGYLAQPVLVRVGEETRWLPGDAVATRRPGALGSFVDARRDLDGDG